MKQIDLLDLPEEARDLVRECEAQGSRSVFERSGRPVAVLVSWDEYLALRETIEMANDPMFYARLEQAEEEIRTGRLDRVAAVDASRGGEAAEAPPSARLENDRVRLADSVIAEWPELSLEERELALTALAKIDDDPIIGAPLFEPFKGLWSHRSGGLRIIYRIVIEARTVVILAVTPVT